MSLEEIASAVVGLIFIVLISGIVICLGAAVYFHFTETPVTPPAAATVEEVQEIPPTEEEIKEMHEKYQEGRSEKAANYCFMALGAFILGWITGKAQFHTVGILFLFGGLIYDYKILATALFLWYFIVPALVIGGIIGLFKRN
jgi:hypothetical protein